MIRNLLIALLLLAFVFSSHAQTVLFVSPNGNDAGKGTINQPLKSIEAALSAASLQKRKKVQIQLRGGVYNLDAALIIDEAHYQNTSLLITAYKNEEVVISGAKPYHLQWTIYKDGIYKANVNFDEVPDRLFLNGVSLPMARYPNYDSSARVFHGTAVDAISDERVSRWQQPAGAYIHALHKGEWGGLHYKITGKDNNGHLIMEGGWQNNRPSPMHAQYRFVENVFEELDAPGEWYYDASAKQLFLYPPTGVDINKASIEVSHLSQLLIIKGSKGKPLKNISIQKIHFQQTARTFMLTREPLLRSDWTIYRGAAILLEQTEACSIKECSFSEIGGNAIFLSNYNKNDTLKDNHIYNIGASAIVFTGNPASVRSPSFSYDAFIDWDKMDYTPGPIDNDYPQYCIAIGNLIHHIGDVEKQSAGVQIEMAANITVSHNSIYHTPRAGINIGDGCWGGNILEYNEVFNTVLETGDHGAFNSWGRDRFWRPQRNIIDSIVAAKPGIFLLDVISPNIIRNNKFQCNHGWDIDLDDGSSNYRIYNNVCLSGGLKLREGYNRVVYNNVIVNNTFHPHVWLKNSNDVFVHNIVTLPYAPILMDNWGKQIDSNFFLSEKGLLSAHTYGGDTHSKAGNALFVNDVDGNYAVKSESPALLIGFRNFDMHTGVTSPALHKLAEHPPVLPLMTNDQKGKQTATEWLGAQCKNIETLGERSAAGLPDEKGVLLINVPAGSPAYKNGLRKGDVMIAMDKNNIGNIADLKQSFQNLKWKGTVLLTLMRNQSVQELNVNLKD
ncbi:MAG: PDZ domain-containing protein [Chitinophagaceae bacterium]